MPAHLTRATFVLAVHDLARSAAHYIDVLGFKDMNIAAPGWAFLERDGVTIRLGECPSAIAPTDLGDHSYFAYIYVDDIDALHAELTSRGADILAPPTSHLWRMREMPIRTIDGHRIMFAQRLSEND